MPRLDEETKETYKAEARFLIAYYHFLLLRAYGPIPIVEKAYDLDTEISDFPPRSNFDKCVQWISDMYDLAYNGLLEQQPTNYYGRATRPAAKTFKAILWLYAASPLFNGNTEFYADTLIDPETGEHLMPQNYDATKWEKALQYALEAEESCTKNGIKLYDGNPDDPTGENPYPSNVYEWRARMTYVDRSTNELIWADTRRESTYDLQNNSTPYDNSGMSWSNIAPTLETVKRFYTENGLPIDVDPSYYPESDWMQTDLYESERTAKLHLKREPRFYAWISFHNGWYEMQKDDAKRIRTAYRKDDTYGIGSRLQHDGLSDEEERQPLVQLDGGSHAVSLPNRPIERTLSGHRRGCRRIGRSRNGEDLPEQGAHQVRHPHSGGVVAESPGRDTQPGKTGGDHTSGALHRALHGRQLPVGCQALEGGRAICQDAHRTEHQGLDR